MRILLPVGQVIYFGMTPGDPFSDGGIVRKRANDVQHACVTPMKVLSLSLPLLLSLLCRKRHGSEQQDDQQNEGEFCIGSIHGFGFTAV